MWELPLVFDVEKNMGNTTHLCNLNIWIEKILSVSRTGELITVFILLLKYIKKTITVALIEEDVLMLWPTALRICQVFPFSVGWALHQ